MFRPFIATCDARLPTLRRFVASYEDIKHVLKRPVVYYRGSSPGFMGLLERLDPVEMIEQPSRRFQYNICHDLPRICHEKYGDEHILFMEDDILFSSKFPHASYHVYDKMLEYKKVHAVTFYGNGQCYWPGEDDVNFMYKFSGHQYYGNLCFAMSPKLVRWWHKNAKEVWEHPVWGWDIKIGQKFEDNGFNWYCTNRHYVQHQIGPSAIDGIVKTVQSARFVP